MRKVIIAVTTALLVSLINFVSAPIANAGCQDYPESITPACVAENLAIAKLVQEAYEAAQIARRLQEEQTARDNAARDAADRAATTAADNALAPDDCARSTNRYVQRCTDIEVERARIASEARSAADRAATTAADNALAPDDCARSTNRFLQRCIDIAVETARVANETKNAADRAAILAADNALAPDDCARSTNRLLQRCIEISVESARMKNEAIDSIRKINELDSLQKLANEKYSANKCDQAANKLLQVCIDSKAGADAVKKETVSLVKKITETQLLLTSPLLDANGEVILTALLKSKSLGSRDMKAILDASSLSADDKKSLSAYAQTLNNLKSIPGTSNFKIPLSKSLTEEFTTSTPKICTVVDGTIRILRSGSCVLGVNFTTESGFEVQASKRIVVRK